MGFLGTALIGADLMDKLGHSAHELGTFMTESTVSFALSFVFKDAVGMAVLGELGGVEEATFGTQLKATFHNLNLSSEQAQGLMGSF